MRHSATDVAIIGGGIAGLTAAYRLAREGVPFRIFEAARRWGGLIRSERSDGFLLDAGPDTLLAHRPEAIALCRELGLGERLMAALPSAKATSVLHHHHLHALPEGMNLGVPARFGPLVGSPLFSWPGKLRMAADLAIPPRSDGADESIASFFRRRLGQQALDRIGDPLLAGIHAGDAERLSVRSNFPSLVEMEAQYGSIIRGAWAASRAGVGKRGAFFSLPDGLGELVDALLLRLPPAALRLGCRVASIRQTTEGFEVEDAEGMRLATRAVVLAAPLWESARLLVSVAPHAAVTLAPMRFTSSATVFLGFRRRDVAHPLEGHGFVVPRAEGLRTRACTFASSKYAERAPQGFVLLKGYLGGSRGPEMTGMDDARVASAFEDEMRDLLGISGRAVLTRVYRWLGASPQMEVGHAKRVSALEAALTSVPGLMVIGAGLRGSGIPNSIAEGHKAADFASSHLASDAELVAQ